MTIGVNSALCTKKLTIMVLMPKENWKQCKCSMVEKGTGKIRSLWQMNRYMVTLNRAVEKSYTAWETPYAVNC